MNQTKKKSKTLKVLGIIVILIVFGLLAFLDAMQDRKLRMASGADQGAYSDRM